MTSLRTEEAAFPARRRPVQQRSHRTVEAIFEATAQVLLESGEAGLTTNRIAERAGVSIGTLYQYFPNKEAILAAQIDDERERALVRLESVLSEAERQREGAEETLAKFVDFCVWAFGGGDPQRRALSRLAWHWDADERVLRALSVGAERIALRLQLWAASQKLPVIAPERIYVATRALMGAIRFASLEQSALLASPLFARELTQMCIAILMPRLAV